jgi:hypothetical protein
MPDDTRGLSRPRSSSVLQVESTFRESFHRPTPPRKLPENKDSTRSGHHGLGIFKYMFGVLSMEDKDKKTDKTSDGKKPLERVTELPVGGTEKVKERVKSAEVKRPLSSLFSDNRDKSKSNMALDDKRKEIDNKKVIDTKKPQPEVNKKPV